MDELEARFEQLWPQIKRWARKWNQNTPLHNDDAIQIVGMRVWLAMQEGFTELPALAARGYTAFIDEIRRQYGSNREYRRSLVHEFLQAQTSLEEKLDNGWAPGIEDFSSDVIRRTDLPNDVRKVRAAFSILTPREVEMMEAYYIEGLSYLELAARHNVTDRTVGATLNHARGKLRRHFQDKGISLL